MSIIIHHGHPGSFKSFGVLQHHAIPALKAGRTIVTNIRGFDSVEKVEEAIGELLPDEAQILNVNTEGRDAKDYMARWFHWVPNGAMVIIDEAQAIYPAKRRDFKVENLDYPGGEDQAAQDDRPADFFIAVDMHRHYNWDVFLCTPHISKVHTEIRLAAQVAFRHYSMGELLPWKKGKWREIEHDPENNGKAKSHAYGVPKEYKSDPVIFKTYQSTKTGDHQSNQGPGSVFKDKRVVGTLLLAGLAIVVFIYFAVSIFERERARYSDDPQTVPNTGQADPDAFPGGNDVRGDQAGSPPAGRIGHPLADATLSISGTVNRLYLFHGHDTQGDFALTQQDLFSYGYRILYIRPCYAQLWWEGQQVSNVYCQRNRIEEPDPRPTIDPDVINPFMTVAADAAQAER